MSKISIKYKTTAGSGEILSLEQKYGLKRESEIAVLRIVGYAGGTHHMEAIKREKIVEYVEKQQSMGIAGE